MPGIGAFDEPFCQTSLKPRSLRKGPSVHVHPLCGRSPRSEDCKVSELVGGLLVTTARPTPGPLSRDALRWLSKDGSLQKDCFLG